MAREIAVVIPAFKVKEHILPLIASIGPFVDSIIVVDDCCPEGSGQFVKQNVKDPRVSVIFNEVNLGVGGAVKRGFLAAAKEGFPYLVKLDGDGQMDPNEIPKLIKPIKEGVADYTKANRFFSPRSLKGMPLIRLVGNGILSFLTKISSGYWQVMDPTNGFVAIHNRAFMALEHEKIDDRYFFETDMLCRLHLISAVVQDVPIPAKYGDEKSNLRIKRVIFTFGLKHLNRLVRRLIYDYFVRDFNVGSIQLVFGLLLFVFGVVFGSYNWYLGLIRGTPTEVGTIMLAILPTIIGFQLLLSALNYDISRREVSAIHKLI